MFGGHMYGGHMYGHFFDKKIALKDWIGKISMENFIS